jgi:hypothetical protein
MKADESAHVHRNPVAGLFVRWSFGRLRTIFGIMRGRSHLKKAPDLLNYGTAVFAADERLDVATMALTNKRGDCNGT